MAWKDDVRVEKRRAPWLWPLLLALGPVFWQGCATASRREAVPDALQATAHVSGFPAGIRYFPRDAGHVKEFERDFLDSLAREKAYLESQGHRGPLPPAPTSPSPAAATTAPSAPAS